MATTMIPVHLLETSHKVRVGPKLFENPERIEPSRKRTHVKVKTKSSYLVYDGYIGQVEVLLELAD